MLDGEGGECRGSGGNSNNVVDYMRSENVGK